MAKIEVPGFARLAPEIKKPSIILLSGGCGTGKTTFVIQSFCRAAENHERCIYITFEEPAENIRESCRSFGWEIDKLEKSGRLLILSIDPMDVAREVEAALVKKRGDLLIRTKGILGFIPKGFKPDRIGIDSISSLYAAFAGQEENYRRYLTKLVEGLRKSGALSFLITESEQGLERYSRSGIEEFLADGVIVMYYVRKGSSRQRAIEVLKLRGTPHLNRIIPFNITRRGIVIRAEERVFE
jgi:KaiC/GvpD/RAD55 family RecA-like ATPase